MRDFEIYFSLDGERVSAFSGSLNIMSEPQWLSIAIGLLLAAWIFVVLVGRMLRRPRWQTLRNGLKNVVDALFGIG
jgi:hypothetical protein